MIEVQNICDKVGPLSMYVAIEFTYARSVGLPVEKVCVSWLLTK